MRWIKIWTDGWFDGSVRFDLTPPERSVWVDLIAFAGCSRWPGIIRASENSPYPREAMAHRFGVSLEFLEQTLEKLKQQDKIHENTTGIHIINWERYQGRSALGTAVQKPGFGDQKPSDEVVSITDNPSDAPISTPEIPPSKPKKEQSEKKQYGEFSNVLLTNHEYQKLQDKFGSELGDKIETLSNGIASKGYKYHSHYATILSWDRRDQKKGGDRGTHKGIPGNRPAGAFDDLG